MPRVNIVCIKWGTKFNANDVNVLYQMVKRNITRPFNFLCLTDDSSEINQEVECRPIPKVEVPPQYAYSPWRKLALFSPELNDIKGKSLFLDLDLVITKNIDEFFSCSDKFCIIENWTQKGRGIGNSSVFSFEFGQYNDVFANYISNMQQVLTSYDNEQEYVSKYIGGIDYWPEEWCASFKRHCIPNYIIRYFKTPVLPKNAKIVVFHGDPKPEDAIKGGFYGNIFKYIKPTKWVEHYWRL